MFASVELIDLMGMMPRPKYLALSQPYRSFAWQLADLSTISSGVAMRWDFSLVPHCQLYRRIPGRMMRSQDQCDDSAHGCLTAPASVQ
jgi:hypothetical protein